MSHFISAWSGRNYLCRATFTQFCFLGRTPRFPTADNRCLVNAAEGGVIIYWTVGNMVKLKKKGNRSDLEARDYKSPPNQRSRSTGNKGLPEASYFYHRMKFA